MYLAFVLLTVFVSYAKFEQLFPIRGLNYGPFVFNLTEYSVCPSWRPQRFKTIVYIEKELDEKYVIVTNITYTDTAQLDSIKVTVCRGSNTSNALWTYVLKHPCQHPVMSAILHKNCGTDRSCIIKQGQYVSKLNISDTIDKFLGGQFFYGEYTFKVTLNTKSYSLLCVLVKCTFSKK